MPETVSRCAEHTVRMGDGVELRVLEWCPTGSVSAAPVLFVAGWLSVVEGWAPLLRALVPHRRVVYVETREKRSARFPDGRVRPAQLTIPRLGRDLVEVGEAVGIDGDRWLAFGSSMGANAILEALKGDRLAVRGAFLVGPNARFEFHWWRRLLICFPAASYHVLKPFVLWYLRRYRIDVAREPEQMARYERTLAAAHPVRIKQSARAVVRYQVWPGLATIRRPVAVAWAPTDTLHGSGEVQRIVAAVPGARAVQCPSNHYMHSAAVAADMDDHLGGRVP